MNYQHLGINGIDLSAGALPAGGAVYAVLAEAVAHAGGHKRAGAALWPALEVERAARRLRDCLAPTRRECLHPHELVQLLALARAGGWHGGMAWLCAAAGYGIGGGGQGAAALGEVDDVAMQLQAAAHELSIAQSHAARAAERAAQLARLVAVRQAVPASFHRFVN